jgi:hypothetical protein
MPELSGLDASILAIIANNAPLAEEQRALLLDRITDPVAKKVGQILANGTEPPPTATKDVRDLVEHIRGWADRNRSVHAVPVRSTSS